MKQSKSFNSTIVRLKGFINEQYVSEYIRFNSTIVRLKAHQQGFQACHTIVSILR